LTDTKLSIMANKPCFSVNVEFKAQNTFEIAYAATYIPRCLVHNNNVIIHF